MSQNWRPDRVQASRPPVEDAAQAISGAALRIVTPNQLVPTASGPLDRNPAAVYLARLSPSSRRVMRSALDAMASILTAGQCDALSLDWPAVRYQHTAAVRTVLAGGRYAPSTANRHLAALRGVLRECWRLGYTSAEEYQRAADLEPIRGSRLPRGRALSSGDVLRLFSAVATNSDAVARRDAAVLAVAYGAGLRRAELVALDLSDLDNQTLKVHGKGNRERLSYLPSGAELAVTEWLRLRGDAPGPLFWPIPKTGIPRPGRLSTQAVLYVTQRWAKRAHIQGFSPHDLRRTFITHLLDAGGDIASVAKLAGHASVSTTAAYDRRDEEAKRRTSGLLAVPFRGRAAL